MTMQKLFLAVTLLTISLASGAQSIFKTKALFKKTGKLSSFEWAPDRYNNNFRYSIFYYIPKKLKRMSNVASLIFMHGGGGSTMTRGGSISTVKMYTGDLQRLADELGMIVVLPSANGLNWNGHTRGLLKDLARLMRTNLNIDTNRMGVSGHSMGGMGITRNFTWIADEFAFFMPQAAGMDIKGQYEYNLNKVFNVPYVHLQGLQDHFDDFVPLTKEQVKRTKDLELVYGAKSKLEAIFYNGSHNYDLGLFKKTVDRLVKSSPRDLYQKELWASFHTVKTTLTENKISFDYDSEARFFWMELTQTDTSVAERTNFHAKITGNDIHIDTVTPPKQSKSMKIYLSSKMLKLDETINVYLNGSLMTTRSPKTKLNSSLITDPNDAGFIFEDSLEFNF